MPDLITPDADGWYTHDGGPCPVDPETWVKCDGQWYNWAEHAAPAAKWEWERVDRYRVFAPVTPGPAPFVRDAAARIMATTVSSDAFLETLDEGDTQATLDATAAFSVRAAKALDAALKEAGNG